MPAHYLKSPSAWQREFIRQRRVAESGVLRAIESDNVIAQKIYEKEVNYIDRQIELEKAYLKDSIKLLRKYVKGLEASDGYDLNNVSRLLPGHEDKVRRYAYQIRQELASPHIEIVPRTPAAIRAVKQHTGQGNIPNRKRFIVHTNKPDTTSVKIVYKTVTQKDARGRKRRVTQAQLELTQQVKGGKIQDRFFYFPQSPRSFDHIVKMTRKMLKFMPKGYYALQSSNHGTIGRSIPSELLIEELQDRYLGYDKFGIQSNKDDRGLAETLTGFKLISFTVKGADREYSERLSTRLQMQKWRKQQRAERQREVLKKKGLYQCRKCGRVFTTQKAYARHTH